MSLPAVSLPVALGALSAPAVLARALLGRSEPTAPRRSVDELLLSALSGMSSAISLVDVRDQRLLYANAAYETLTGHGVQQALGRSWNLMEGEIDAATAHEIRETIRRGGELRMRVRRRRKDGEPYWSETFLSPVADDSGSVNRYIVVEKDVTAHVEREERAAHLAYHDALTGLPNRSQLQEHLALALARAARSQTAFGLLFLDLDGFKAANDRYGHEAGDQVLKAVAERWLTAARDGDVLARYGGDEFVVLLTELQRTEPKAAAIAAAERYRNAIREPLSVSAASGIVTSVSVGIAIYPDDGDSAAALLMAADAAMYVGKRAFAAPGRGPSAPGVHMSVTATMRTS